MHDAHAMRDERGQHSADRWRVEIAEILEVVERDQLFDDATRHEVCQLHESVLRNVNAKQAVLERTTFGANPIRHIGATSGPCRRLLERREAISRIG